MLGWSIYLTNVPEKKLSLTEVIAFYRIRWQIELVFKFWKSYCGLVKLPGVRPERVMTEFYAKLLVVIVSNFLVATIRLPQEGSTEHEIGIFQVHKVLGDFAQDLLAQCFDQRVFCKRGWKRSTFELPVTAINKSGAKTLMHWHEWPSCRQPDLP